MRTSRRGRGYVIVAASVAVHAALLAVVAVQSPRLAIPRESAGPPVAVIPILILPKVPPPAAQPGARPTPIRLHRRPQRFVAETPSVAPLPVPVAKEAPARAPAAAGPRQLPLPTSQDPVAVNARNALRSRLGCTSADAVGLSAAEREACENRLAQGARDAEFEGLGVERGKAAVLGAAAAKRERDFRYMRSGGGQGVVGAGPSATANAPGRGVNLPGATAEAIGAATGSDRPTLKAPF